MECHWIKKLREEEFDNRFKIKKVFSEGAFGKVYASTEVAQSRAVMIKKIVTKSPVHQDKERQALRYLASAHFVPGLLKTYRLAGTRKDQITTKDKPVKITALVMQYKDCMDLQRAWK